MNIELNPRPTSVPPNSKLTHNYSNKPDILVNLCQLLWFKQNNFTSAKFKETFFFFLKKADSLEKVRNQMLIQRGIFIFVLSLETCGAKFSSQLHDWRMQ